MTDREAMQMALEALEMHVLGFEGVRKMELAIEALEAALAQPEPVALKMVYGEVCYQSKHDDQSFGMWCPITEREFPNGTPFYTTLPKRKWVGLTHDDIENLWNGVQWSISDFVIPFTRAVEAALRSKNEY